MARSITYSQVQKKTKELPWCHVCKVNFTLDQELIDHFESSHPEEQPYKVFHKSKYPFALCPNSLIRFIVL